MLWSSGEPRPGRVEREVENAVEVVARHLKGSVRQRRVASSPALSAWVRKSTTRRSRPPVAGAALASRARSTARA